MQFVIENAQLSVTVDTVGCEIVSIFGKKDGCDYLWNADSAFWNGHAPTMFPICGRLCDGIYTYRGKQYAMMLHGFLSHCPFTVLQKNPASITMVLSDDETTYAMYPFHFTVEIAYTLQGDTILARCTIHNLSDSEMPYAIGGHPGFKLPLGGEGTFEDSYIEFDESFKAERLIFSDRGLLMRETEPFAMEDGRRFPLSHGLFDCDAIFLTEVPKAVTLRSKATAKSIRLQCDAMKYLGFWHPCGVDAPFVTIEPWTGVPAYEGIVDDLDTKRDMIRIPTGEKSEFSYSITIVQ